MYLIAGLGNPGKKYEHTRHNIGFIAIDLLASKLDIKVNKLKFKSLIGEGYIGTEKVVLLKPQTFMNLSGEALRDAVNFYKVPNENILVIYDDIDLEAGKLRIRKQGSAGTHNGMKSIIYQLGFDDFPRFRLGVSKPINGQDLANFVLSNFSKDEIKPVAASVDSCIEAVQTAVKDGIDLAMNRYN